MSYSKEFYFAGQDPYDDEYTFCLSLEKDFKNYAVGGIQDEFYDEFTSIERKILKRIVSTKEPAHKIAGRLRWSNDNLAYLLLRAVANFDKHQREQDLKDPTRKRRPCFGCGHPIVGKPSDGCFQCNDNELAEITKHDPPHPTILNFHNPEEPDDV